MLFDKYLLLKIIIKHPFLESWAYFEAFSKFTMHFFRNKFRFVTLLSQGAQNKSSAKFYHSFPTRGSPLTYFLSRCFRSRLKKFFNVERKVNETSNNATRTFAQRYYIQYVQAIRSSLCFWSPRYKFQFSPTVFN